MSAMSRGWRPVFKLGTAMSLVVLLSAPTDRLRAARGLKVSAQNQGTAADQPFVRYDLSSDKADITSLRNGVLAMMKLDCADGKEPPECEMVAGGTKPDDKLSPLGWKYQASIHGSLPGAVDQPAWDTCQHSSFFFLSWHRMELYFFERILRKMSGNKALTLPYWDFKDQPKLPPSFRTEMISGKPNALWWKFRSPKLNVDDKPLCPAVVATKLAFEQPVFFTPVWASGRMSFGGGARSTPKHGPGQAGGGQIERTPHDQIHLSVGNGGPLSMSRVAGSGLDPIFWPIHTNIDRAWACWQSLRNAPSEPQTGPWVTEEFEFFDVQDAAPGYKMVKMTGKQVVDTVKDLIYKYDNNCVGFETPGKAPDGEEEAVLSRIANAALSASAESRTILAAEPVTVTMTLSNEFQNRIRDVIAAAAPSGSIVLTVGGVAADKPSGASYEIYLNLPEGVAPDPQSEYYVDNLSFFGVGEEHHHDGAMTGAAEDNSLRYDLTDVIRQLAAGGEWPGDRVWVTFANTAAATPDCAGPPSAPPDARARFASLTLTVE